MSIKVNFVCGRSYWSNLVSLAFLLRSRSEDHEIEAFLCSSGESADNPYTPFADFLETLQQKGLLKYTLMPGVSYQEAATHAMSQLRIHDHNYVFLHLDDVLITPNALGFMTDLMNQSKALKMKFGALSAHQCLGAREYRIRGQRGIGKNILVVPQQSYIEGLTLFDKEITNHGFSFPFDEKFLEGTATLAAIRNSGFDLGIPSNPIVQMQRLNKQPVTNVFEEIRARTHRDVRNKEVEIPHFSIDDFRLRTDKEWEAEACRRCIQDLSPEIPELAPLFLDALSVTPPSSGIKVVMPDDVIANPPKRIEKQKRLGVAFFCCARWFHTILTLAYYFAYRIEDADIFAFVDKPKSGGVPEKLTKVLTELTQHGFISGTKFHDHNVGLTQNITTGITELGMSGNYEYVMRLEDDLLIGPDSLRMLLDCMDKSKTDERPIGLISGIATSVHPGLRPIRFRHVGPYLVGIAGHNLLEPICILRTSMASKGFTWALEHPKAYATTWLNKLRSVGFEGATIIQPTIHCMHYGYKTTVPDGTPVAPSKEYYTGKIITMPGFDFQQYLGCRNDDIQAEYCLKVLRQMSNVLKPEVSRILLSAFL